MLLSRSVRRPSLWLALGSALLLAGTGACGNEGGTPTPDVVVQTDTPSTPDEVVGIDTSSDPGPAADATADAVTPPPDGPEPFECKGNPDVPCIDESFQDLGLFETVNPAAVTEEGTDSGVFVTHVDTTAGGMTPTESFIYVRFTDTGLEKLDISDDDAFSDTDWDLGLRRFVLRLNSGVSGPSCVTAGRTAPGTTFDGLTEVPDGLQYRVEEYFTTPDCGYVSDGSGIGSPGTALASFWTYPGCVQMTGNVYVIQRADGRHVKLEVLSYYTPDVQEICQTDGALPPNMASGSGNIRIKWAFLD